MESLKVCLAFPKNDFVFVDQIWYFLALHKYSITQNIRFKVLRNFKTIFFWKTLSFTRKVVLCSLMQVLHFWALYQYSVTRKIQFRILTEPKTSLYRTPMREESFWKVSRSASLCQKNGLVFVNRIWHYKAWNQYSMAYKIWFRLLRDLKINLKEFQIYWESFWKVCLTFSEFFFDSLTKFGIFQSFTNIEWLRRFCLGFRLTSKQAYMKLWYA